MRLYKKKYIYFLHDWCRYQQVLTFYFLNYSKRENLEFRIFMHDDMNMIWSN